MIDYYEILGVAESAEEITIKSSYKVLAMKYHPDRWVGDKDYAEMKMRELNIAYEVLLDPDKRMAYDLSRKNGSDKCSSVFDAELRDIDGWAVILQFYPEMQKYVDRLDMISDSLGYEFQKELLEKKKYDNAEIIAERLERSYLKSVFGGQERVQLYGKKLILSGNIVAAGELMNMVSVMGDNVDADRAIALIRDKYGIVEISLARLSVLNDRMLGFLIFISVCVMIAFIVAMTSID